MKYTEEQRWHYKMFGYYPPCCYGSYAKYLEAQRKANNKQI